MPNPHYPYSNLPLLPSLTNTALWLLCQPPEALPLVIAVCLLLAEAVRRRDVPENGQRCSPLPFHCPTASRTVLLCASRVIRMNASAQMRVKLVYVNVHERVWAKDVSLLCLVSVNVNTAIQPRRAVTV